MYQDTNDGFRIKSKETGINAAKIFYFKILSLTEANDIFISSTNFPQKVFFTTLPSSQ